MTDVLRILAVCDVQRGTVGLAQQYHELLAQGKVAVQGCRSCDHMTFPPLLLCPRCGEGPLQWWSAGPTACAISWVTVHVSDSTDTISLPRRLRRLVPYTTVVVELDHFPDVRIAALMLGASALHSGDPLVIFAGEVAGTLVTLCKPAARAPVELDGTTTASMSFLSKGDLDDDRTHS